MGQSRPTLSRRTAIFRQVGSVAPATTEPQMTQIAQKLALRHPRDLRLVGACQAWAFAAARRRITGRRYHASIAST